MKKFNWFIFSFLALAIFACDDDEAVVDTEDPTIVFTSPTSGATFNNDEAVPVQATVNDNLGLDEVTIWVTPPGAEPQLVHTQDVSSFLNDEREAEIDEIINLGTGAVEAGTWTIEIRAVDERGNEAKEPRTITVREPDPNAPTLSITSPEAGATFQAGSDMILSALVEEDMSLSSVEVVVVAGNETPIYDTTITEFTDATMFQLQDTVTIPREAATGTYTLTIAAEDLAGNVVDGTRTFMVTEPGARATFTLAPEDLPAGTTEEDDIFISGEFANALFAEPGTDDRFLLTTNEDGTRSITLDLATETEMEGVNQFIFGRAGGLSTIEVNEFCEDITNRQVVVDSDDILVDDVTIAAWKDRCE